MTMQGIAYYDGQWGDPDQLRVPILERGFLFGEGVYEVIHAINGLLWDVDAHLERLAQSLAVMEIRPPLPPEDLTALIKAGLDQLPAAFHTVYLQITRGAAPRRHSYANIAERSVLTMIINIDPKGPPRSIRPGKAITFPDLRWQRCDIKTLNLIANTMAATAMERAGAEGAILLRDDLVTEGAAQTVCRVSNNVIYTAPLSNMILPSTTRQYVLNKAAAWGLDIREESYTLEQLLAADEVLMLSTSHCPLPIVSVDGIQIGDGQIGPIARLIWNKHREEMIGICGPLD